MPDPEIPVPYLDADGVRGRVTEGSSTISQNDDWIAETVAEFEKLIEEHKRVAFTPRPATEEITCSGWTSKLFLRWPKVREVTSVTVDGDELADDRWTVDKETGIITVCSALAPGSVVVVVYVHGFDADEFPNLLRATALYVERISTQERAGNTPDVYRQGFDGGSTSYVMPDPANEKPTGFREIDRLVHPHFLPSYRIPGIA